MTVADPRLLEVCAMAWWDRPDLRSSHIPPRCPGCVCSDDESGCEACIEHDWEWAAHYRHVQVAEAASGLNYHTIQQFMRENGLREKWKRMRRQSALEVKRDAEAAMRRSAGLPQEKPIVPARERRGVPYKLRFQVLTRDRHRCVYCGAASHEAKLHIDHVVPFSKGGPTTVENLATACEACNLGKGDRSLPEQEAA